MNFVLHCAVNPKQSMLLLCFFLLLFYSSDLAIAIARSSELRSDQFHHKNIFILAGQSNMAGRGGIIDDKWDGIVPSECQSNSLVLRLNARSNWEEAREPLHADIDVNKACGIGPGMAFANSIREMHPKIGTIGLVPCAIGGTNISEWHRGLSLYNNLVIRAKAALKQGGTIRAILWYQGESDTISRADAELYGLNLKKLMLDLRADLDSPMLPIIQVALASGQGPFIEIVRKAQLGLRLSNVRCIDAKGLQLEPDWVHLTTLSQVKLGQMFALEFIKTLQNPVAFIHNNVSRSNSNLFQELCMSSLWRSLLTCMILLLIT